MPSYDIGYIVRSLMTLSRMFVGVEAEKKEKKHTHTYARTREKKEIFRRAFWVWYSLVAIFLYR